MMSESNLKRNELLLGNGDFIARKLPCVGIPVFLCVTVFNFAFMGKIHVPCVDRVPKDLQDSVSGYRYLVLLYVKEEMAFLNSLANGLKVTLLPRAFGEVQWDNTPDFSFT